MLQKLKLLELYAHSPLKVLALKKKRELVYSLGRVHVTADTVHI